MFAMHLQVIFKHITQEPTHEIIQCLKWYLLY